MLKQPPSAPPPASACRMMQEASCERIKSLFKKVLRKLRILKRSSERQERQERVWQAYGLCSGRCWPDAQAFYSVESTLGRLLNMLPARQAANGSRAPLAP